MATFVNIEDVRTYIRDDGAETWTDDQLQETVDSEFSAQTAKCRQVFLVDEDSYPEDLRQAMLRRCQRALAMRGQVLGMQTSPEGDAVIIPRNDPEIVRLEGPYKRMPVG
jgi:hypothetical protein